MKFNVTSSDLNRGLSAVIGVVPSKATLPILETILFESEDGRLKLTATDMDISVIEYIDAEIEEEGAVAIPARRMLDTLKQLPSIPVYFHVDDRNQVEFKTDRGTYKLVGESADDFPDTSDMADGTRFVTKTEVIRKGIQKTLFAVSSDDLRPAMMGVLFEVMPTGTRFVATDGHRLVRYVNKRLTSEEEVQFIVPEKALSLVQKALSGEECEMTLSRDNVRFKSGNAVIVTRLISEQYPNYDSVIPRDNDKLLHISREEMLSAVRRVSVFSSSTTRQIRLELGQDKLILRAEDLDMSSEAKESVACDYASDPMEIGFNAKYLADVLNNVSDDEVVFEFSTPNRAGIVKPGEESEDEKMFMLVMPVMLNSYS